MKPQLLSIEEALTRLFALATPLPPVVLPLEEAYGLRLAEGVTARRAQPPFDASAMDGYAIADSSPRAGKSYRVIGEAAAGHGFAGHVGDGEAVRIFTGAPVPQGACHVVIQEDTIRENDVITLTDKLETGRNIRFKGNDFAEGESYFPSHPLGAADLGLIASMNIPELRVTPRPHVVILPTGDELVPLGGSPNAAQIINSNVYSLAALAREAGAHVTVLPIVPDRLDALTQAMDVEADVILTIGGASVGDHDLIAPAARASGFALDFHKIALRPGKPLLLGHRNTQILLGLPGNPVSGFVCATLFLKPLLRRLAGGPAKPAPFQLLPLGAALPANGPRDHFLRATLKDGKVYPAERQDSALQQVLAQSDGLALQPKGSTGMQAGDYIQFYAIRSLDI